MDKDPARILALAATELGLAEFERRGKPESVQPRHYQDVRLVLDALSSALYIQGGGARAYALNELSRLLSEAADAPGPDRKGSRHGTSQPTEQEDRS